MSVDIQVSCKGQGLDFPGKSYFWPCCATASRRTVSSPGSHGPFLRPPHTWFTHLLRQSLFVRR